MNEEDLRRIEREISRAKDFQQGKRHQKESLFKSF